MLIGITFKGGRHYEIYSLELRRKQIEKKGYNKKGSDDEDKENKEKLGAQKYTHLLKSFDYVLADKFEIDLIDLVENRNSTRLY